MDEHNDGLLLLSKKMAARFSKISYVEIQKKRKNWTNVSRATMYNIFKSDGSDYEPDRLRVMLALPDRPHKHNNHKISIAKDPGFVKCRQCWEGKARALREKGHGKRPNATKALTVQDEEH